MKISSDNCLRITVSVASFLVVGIRSLWPSIINIDGISLGLIVLAALPWLAPLIKSVELPGIGKIELQELKRKAEEAQGAASSADRKAELALAGRGSGESFPPAGAIDEPLVKLEQLADQYNEIRKQLKAGPSRTSQMTAVVSKMIALAERLDAFKVLESLHDSSNAGRRLAAYAYLYARPEPTRLSDIVESVTKLEGKPFGQYWGIQAIGKVLGGIPTEGIGMETLNSLRTMYVKLPKGTDRHYELGRILSVYSNPQGIEPGRCPKCGAKDSLKGPSAQHLTCPPKSDPLES